MVSSSQCNLKVHPPLPTLAISSLLDARYPSRSNCRQDWYSFYCQNSPLLTNKTYFQKERSLSSDQFFYAPFVVTICHQLFPRLPHIIWNYLFNLKTHCWINFDSLQIHSLNWSHYLKISNHKIDHGFLQVLLLKKRVPGEIPHSCIERKKAEEMWLTPPLPPFIVSFNDLDWTFHFFIKVA